MIRGALLAVLALALVPSPAAAEVDGFGGPTVALTQLDGETALLFGGRGGALFDGRFILGGGGFGLANSDIATGGGSHLTLGYGGLWAGWIRPSEGRFTVAVHVLAGAGSVGRDGGGIDDSDDVWIAEPAVELWITAGDSLRLSVGASYRAVSGLELPGLEAGDVAGPSLTVGVAFGGFGR